MLAANLLIDLLTDWMPDRITKALGFLRNIDNRWQFAGRTQIIDRDEIGCCWSWASVAYDLGFCLPDACRILVGYDRLAPKACDSLRTLHVSNVWSGGIVSLCSVLCFGRMMEQEIAHGGETRDRHPRPINFRFPLRLSGQRVNRDRANCSRISLQSTAEFTTHSYRFCVSCYAGKATLASDAVPARLPRIVGYFCSTCWWWESVGCHGHKHNLIIQICDPLCQKGNKVSVWSFWVIATNRKCSQRALTYVSKRCITPKWSYGLLK